MVHVSIITDNISVVDRTEHERGSESGDRIIHKGMGKREWFGGVRILSWWPFRFPNAKNFNMQGKPDYILSVKREIPHVPSPPQSPIFCIAPKCTGYTWQLDNKRDALIPKSHNAFVLLLIHFQSVDALWKKRELESACKIMENTRTSVHLFRWVTAVIDSLYSPSSTLRTQGIMQ